MGIQFSSDKHSLPPKSPVRGATSTRKYVLVLSVLNYYYFFPPPLNQPTAKRRKKANKYSERDKKPETVSGQKTLG